MAVQYEFFHIIVTIDTILLIQHYLHFYHLGQLLPELPNIWPSVISFLHPTLKLHSISSFFSKFIMLHVDWLLALQKVNLHSWKWSAASTSSTWSLVEIDDHLKLDCSYCHKITLLKSNMNPLNPTALTWPTPFIQRKAKTREIFHTKTFQILPNLHSYFQFPIKSVASFEI